MKPERPIEDELEPAFDRDAVERVWQRLDAPPEPVGISRPLPWLAVAALAVLVAVALWPAPTPEAPLRPTPPSVGGGPPSPSVEAPPIEAPPAESPPGDPPPVAPPLVEPPPLPTPGPETAPHVPPPAIEPAAIEPDVDQLRRDAMEKVLPPARRRPRQNESPEELERIHQENVLHTARTFVEKRPRFVAQYLEENAWEPNHRTAEYYVLLSDAWHAAGEPERARRAARRALRAEPDGTEAGRMRQRTVPTAAPK